MLEYSLLVNIKFIGKGILLTKNQTLFLQQHNRPKH